MKKTIASIAIALAISAFASPRAPFNVRHHHMPPPMHIQASRPAPRPMPKPMPRPVVHHLAPHHSHSVWGPGGRNFWPGFIGGVVGSTLISQPAPVVIAAPPPPGPYARQVWIEGHYETQIVNGIYTQVWVPGRWVIVR